MAVAFSGGSIALRINSHLFELGIQSRSREVLRQCSSPSAGTAQPEEY